MLNNIICILGTLLIIAGVVIKVSKNPQHKNRHDEEIAPTTKKKPNTAVIITVIGITLIFLSTINV